MLPRRVPHCHTSEGRVARLSRAQLTFDLAGTLVVCSLLATEINTEHTNARPNALIVAPCQFLNQKPWRGNGGGI